MSQPDNQDPERGNVIDHHFNHPLSASNQPSQGESNFGDTSGPLFMYSKIAEEEDDKMAELWQKDADGIINFNGLFSAVFVTLVAVSVQDLRPNSQDTSAYYLEKMYQLQADPDISRPSTPSAQALAQPPAFSPPTYTV